MRWVVPQLIVQIGILLFVSMLPLTVQADAAEYHYAQHDGIIGAMGTYQIKENDSLIELARKFGLGYNEIVAANPGIDPILPEKGANITIPTKWILPDVPHREGIVINLSEMRLYYFPSRARGRVLTFPIGIGDEGWETPTGTFTIIEKIAHPSWHVPRSIRRQKPELPAIVPPGPDNPLGTHALRLSIGTVLIHGTDRPFGIGRKVSHGCIHLYPEDIRKLYKLVGTGSKVTIVRQPVKTTVADSRVMVEVHDGRAVDMKKTAYDMLVRKGLIERVNIEKLAVTVAEKTGIPKDVTW